MWKAMLECHHSQYITISLAYHSRNSTDAPPGDAWRQIMAQLRQEIECFGVSFTDWINSHASYLEAVNGWLQNCIIEPQERSKNHYPFSPHRYLGFGPLIFVLCREWSAGLKALPAEELSVAIKDFLSDICHLMDQQVDQLQKKDKSVDADNGESESKHGLYALTDGNTTDDVSSNLSCIQASLTRVLDRLNKFSEASVKMYEDVRQKTDAAQIAYLNLALGLHIDGSTTVTSQSLQPRSVTSQGESQSSAGAVLPSSNGVQPQQPGSTASQGGSQPRVLSPTNVTNARGSCSAPIVYRRKARNVPVQNVSARPVDSSSLQSVPGVSSDFQSERVVSISTGQTIRPVSESAIPDATSSANADEIASISGSDHAVDSLSQNQTGKGA
ncbi:hypothetical protein V6N11_022734 [Hibiscus sabdariffa]|uniref:DUF632 domain-containing protein n=1 Tax=Hibiscus sabdariffa TaxID=183260 RepID=A0ABR2TKI6_9ROSI